MIEPNHLFVYGTLRAESAHPMAHRLSVGAKLIGRGSTPGLLYDLGACPGAVFAPEERHRVIGEVFQLGPTPGSLPTSTNMKAFTEKPEVPEAKGLFRRIAVEVSLDQGGTVEAWAYGLKEAPRARLIGTGDFIADRRLRAPRAARP